MLCIFYKISLCDESSKTLIFPHKSAITQLKDVHGIDYFMYFLMLISQQLSEAIHHVRFMLHKGMSIAI